MNKEIKFLMKFDTSEFDRAVEKMQRQLREVYRPMGQQTGQKQTADRLDSIGLGGIMQKPGVEAYFKSMQSARQGMDQILAQGAKAQAGLMKDIQAQEQYHRRKVEQQKEVIKGSQEELMIKRQIQNAEESLYRMREAFAHRNQTLNQAMDARQKIAPSDKLERLATAFGGGGMKGGVAEAGMMGGEMWKGLGMTGQAGLVLAGILAAAKGMKMVGQAYVDYNRMPLESAGQRGSATQGIYGREINAAYGGTQMSEMAFMPEKQQAAGMSGTALQSQKAFSEGTSATGMGGAMLRQGKIGHAILGFGMGLVGDIFDEKSRQYDLSQLKNVPGLRGIGKRFDEAYQSRNAEQYAKDYAKATEDMKAQNPLKTAAVDEFQANYQRNLAFQRSTGLDYQSFSGKGGFRENAINSGFTDQMAMDAAGGILGSGGSTRMAQGGSVLSLQAQRNFDMTNSNQVLGKISGQMGDTESSRQVFIKMLAEGSKLGLDSSQFREENRRFMDAASTIVERTGSTSQDDIQRILQQFGGFVGSPTIKGMEAAQTAFQTYNSATSQTQGPQGVMRSAAFMRDPIIGGMAGPDMAALAGIDMEHLNTDHPVIKDLAARYNTTPEKLVAAARKAGQSSFHRLKKGDDLQSRLTDIRSQLAKDPGDMTPQELQRRSKLNQEKDAMMNEYATTLALEYPQLANDPQALQRLAEGTTSGNPEDQAKAFDEMKKKTEDKLGGKGDTGRPEDRAVAAGAEASRLVLENFQKFHDVIVPSVPAIQAYNKALQDQIDMIMKLPAAQRAAALQSNPLLPKQQSQSNKPGGN